MGISFCDVAAVITFPFVYLSEHFEWKALGIFALPLNSFVWGSAVYVSLGNGKARDNETSVWQLTKAWSSQREDRCFA